MHRLFWPLVILTLSGCGDIAGPDVQVEQHRDSARPQSVARPGTTSFPELPGLKNLRGSVAGGAFTLSGTLDLNGWDLDQFSTPGGWRATVWLEADGLPGIDYSITHWGEFVTYDIRSRTATGEASVKVTPGHLRITAPLSGLGSHERFTWILVVSPYDNVATWDWNDAYIGDTGRTPGRN